MIRCWEPRDAELLKDAVDRSHDHLWPWMPWTPEEPEELEVVVARLRGFRARFDGDENWVYGTFDRAETRVLGGAGLHPRSGPGSLEIGYWVAADVVRRGIATEVTAVLTRAAFEHAGADRVDVGVDRRNEASLGVGRKLGFHVDGVVRRRIPGRPGEALGDMALMTMLPEELRGSPCAAYDYVAYDVVGARL